MRESQDSLWQKYITCRSSQAILSQYHINGAPLRETCEWTDTRRRNTGEEPNWSAFARVSGESMRGSPNGVAYACTAESYQSTIIEEEDSQIDNVRSTVNLIQKTIWSRIVTVFSFMCLVGR